MRLIKELAWDETSLVIWGMNPEALIDTNSVKWSSLHSAIESTVAEWPDPDEARRDEMIRTLQLRALQGAQKDFDQARRIAAEELVRDIIIRQLDSAA